MAEGLLGLLRGQKCSYMFRCMSLGLPEEWVDSRRGFVFGRALSVPDPRRLHPENEVQMPNAARLELPLVQQHAALTFETLPANCAIGALLTDAIQLAPPASQAAPASALMGLDPGVRCALSSTRCRGLPRPAPPAAGGREDEEDDRERIPLHVTRAPCPARALGAAGP